MPHDFFFTARNAQRNNSFGDNADVVRYLMIDEQATAICPSDAVRQKAWLAALIQPPSAAASGDGALRQLFHSDILIYIHGYNDSENDILTNHRKLKAGLKEQGFTGQLVSFDWPCGSTPLAYLGDRHKARMTAMSLVDGGICLLAAQQRADCTVNVHLLAHSTGAFVVREAFDDAEKANKLPTADWLVSQLIFISGDISSSSMDADSKECGAIYRHSVRFTNYHNPYDAALALSNVKRAGFENRVGRVGLPPRVPSSAVDIDCGPYYHSICQGRDLFWSHSWYFDDKLFMNDLAHTIGGLTDRNYMASRKIVDGLLQLSPQKIASA